MTTSKKSISTLRSTPKKPEEIQTTPAVTIRTLEKTKSKSDATFEQQSKQVDGSGTVKTPTSVRRKRRAEELEELVVANGASADSKKRQRTTKAKEEDVIPKIKLQKAKGGATAKVKEDIDEDTESSPKKTGKKRTEANNEQEFNQKPVTSPKKTKKNLALKGEEDFDEQTALSPRKNKENKVKKEEEDDVDNEKKTKRKRKTKEEKEAEAMPLAARANGLRMFIGAHVSCAKGVQNSVTNALHIGGNAFAMFLKSQRKWENPPLQDEHRDQFRAFCDEHKYDAASHILPHGSYLVNLAQEDPDKATQAYKAFLDDLHRCDTLGIKLYNFHPGSTGSAPRPSAIARIASALNRAHAATTTVTPVLEAMAGSNNVIGSTFEDLRDIITLVDKKSRIGVCIDTCHIFAAGYDLRSPGAFKETLEKFDDIVGMQYLRALHLNDSKAPLASHRDLHQNIGLGFLGLRAFHNVMNEKRFEGLPLVLETPIDKKDTNGKDVEDKGIWAKEIKLLEGLIGMDAESEEFKKMERELADKGAVEREKYQEAFERKKVKETKKEKGQTRLSFGKRKGKSEESDGSHGE